jgi:general secretion pathway protein K
MTRPRQDGFVLIAVIWFVALIALAATLIAGWISDSLGRAADLKERVAAEQEMIDATSRIAYLMTSSYFTIRELVPISADEVKVPVNPMGYMPGKDAKMVVLDSRPYRFDKGVVELQDRKGLFNLSGIDPYTFDHLLEGFGIGSEEASGLLDKLLDYESANTTTRRLNGASNADYAHAGLPPPRNTRIITPWEPFRVLGWTNYPALWKGPVSFADLVTIDTESHGFNPNTAPPALLLSLPGVDQDAADKLIAAREAQPITTLMQMEAVTGLVIPISISSVSPFPANSLRVTLAFPDDPLARVVGISLPPVGNEPYRIDYVADVPQEAPLHAALGAAKLPPLPDLAPAP